jgi:CRP/FNR family transcriptional regulator, cyclic AMP receptor protein
MNPDPNDRYEEAFGLLRINLRRFSLPLELVDELIERHIAISFQKGTSMFCEGNVDGMLSFIMSGYVNIYCAVGDGNRTLVRLAGPGEVIGYPDYVDGKGRLARMFEAQVVSKCTAAFFSRDQIVKLIADYPTDVLISILTALNTFWSENLRHFVTLLNLPLRDRLEVVMSDLAARASARDSEGVILIPELGHEDLAEMIGCSRPMVSRMIAEMTESGLLARRGKQYVLLDKWNFDNNSRNSNMFSARSELAASKGSVAFARPPGSSNRRLAAHAARRTVGA